MLTYSARIQFLETHNQALWIFPALYQLISPKAKQSGYGLEFKEKMYLSYAYNASDETCFLHKEHCVFKNGCSFAVLAQYR